MLLLQIASALLLLFNKWFVFQKKTIGWTFGMWGAVIISVYFYFQMILESKLNLWIMIIYDVALFCVMAYGYLLSHSKNKIHLREFLQKYGLRIKIGIVSFTIIVCGYLFSQISADFVLEQFLSALGGMFGTLFLAFNKRFTNKIGWVVYFFTHLIVTDLMIKTNSPFIAACQVASAFVSILGLVREVNPKAFIS
jgi:hypothetical protein